jgi:WD40 repeat protein
MARPTSGSAAGPVQGSTQLEEIVERFEKAWQEGPRPALEQYLPADSAIRGALLVELAHVDLERRLKAGEAARVEPYLQRFPELARNPQALLDLIQAEYRLRREREAGLTAAEYALRFPEHADRIGRLLVPAPVVPPEASPAAEVDRLTWGDEPVTRVLGSPPPPAAALPEEFGRYRILRVLGEGGMGTVFLAHDTELDREVALKVPRLAPEDGSAAVERFVRSARAAATLAHPNLCPVYDAGQFQGIPYLTMPHLEGRPLAALLQEGGPRPPEWAVALVHKLALALQAAHQKGIVHRDLKPANILLTPAGEPIVMDFGLARRENSARMTQTGQVLGTPGYIAPEQLSGVPEAQGSGCDIFSLGVILYELLTGELPFGRTLNDVLLNIMTREPVPPSVRRPGIDPALDGICLRAMARKVEDRYRTMAALAEALGSFLGKPGPAVPQSMGTGGKPPPGEPAEKARPDESASAVRTLARAANPRQTLRPGLIAPAARAGAGPPGRRPRWLWLAGGGVAAGSVLLAVLFATHHVSDRAGTLEHVPVPVPVPERSPTHHVPDRAGTLELQLEGPATEATVRIDGQVVQAEQRRDPIRLEAGSHDLEVTGEWLEGIQQQVAVRPGENLPFPVRLVRLAPTPGLVAEIFQGIHFNKRRHVRVKDRVEFVPQYGQPPEPGMSGEFYSMRWSGYLKPPRAGRYKLVVHHDDGARLWLDGKPLIQDAWHHGAGQRSSAAVEFSEGYHPLRLEYFQEDGAANLSLRWAPPGAGDEVPVPAEALWHNANTVAEVSRRPEADPSANGGLCLAGHTAPVLAVAISSDGRRLLSGGADGTMRLWDVETGKEFGTFPTQPGPVFSVALSADSSRALSTDANGVIRLWDVATRQESRSLRGHQGAVRKIAFTAKETRVVSAGEDGTVRLWNTATGDELSRFSVPTAPRHGMALSPDGSRVLAADDTAVHLADTSRKGVVRDFKGSMAQALAGMAISPDNRLALWSQEQSQVISVRDVASGEELRQLTGHLSWSSALAFSADGRRALSGGWDTTVRLWDVESGRQLRRFLGHLAPVRQVAFFPDGRRAVSCADDNTIRIWDLSP